MAQRTQHLDRHGTGSSVTRRCPDKEILGRYLFNIKASGPGQSLRAFRDPDSVEDDED